IQDEKANTEDTILFQPIVQTGKRFYITVMVLLLIIIWAFYAWIYQLRYGLGVTGLNRPVFWGFYIINFVFFIGISHAGTLISAILRLALAEWRRAINKGARAITVLVLFFGFANFPLCLGSTDR